MILLHQMWFTEKVLEMCLKILITNEDGEDDTVTSNVVYREVFRNVQC